MADDSTDHDRIDPTGQIPEADLLDQQTPLDPTLTDEPAPAHRDASTEPVDEADRWEQQQPVPTPDDDYPYDDPDDGSEAGLV